MSLGRSRLSATLRSSYCIGNRCQTSGGIGATAVHLAAAGKNAVMPVIRRLSDKPYRWRVDTVGLAAVANHERKMPANFIGKDGYSITAACRRYLTPLIHGENYPPFTNGLPRYATLKNTLTKKKLPKFSL